MQNNKDKYISYDAMLNIALHMASKEDLAYHREDMQRQFNDVKQDISEVKQEINAIKADINSNFKWLMGTIITGIIMCPAIYGSLLYFFTK